MCVYINACNVFMNGCMYVYMNSCMYECMCVYIYMHVMYECMHTLLFCHIVWVVTSFCWLFVVTYFDLTKRNEHIFDSSTAFETQN